MCERQGGGDSQVSHGVTYCGLDQPRSRVSLESALQRALAPRIPSTAYGGSKGSAGINSRSEKLGGWLRSVATVAGKMMKTLGLRDERTSKSFSSEMTWGVVYPRSRLGDQSILDATSCTRHFCPQCVTSLLHNSSILFGCIFFTPKNLFCSTHFFTVQ